MNVSSKLIRSSLSLTWSVVCSPSAAWTCRLLLPVLLQTDVVLSPALWGVTLPVLPELHLLCPLLLVDDPLTPVSKPLAWLSWALIRSFCLLSWAISASMASWESCEPRGSEVSDKEDVEGRLVRGRLVRLETELWAWTPSQESLSTWGSSWCSCTGRVPEGEGEKQGTQ